MTVAKREKELKSYVDRAKQYFYDGYT